MDVWLDDERDPTNSVVKFGFKTTGNEVWVKTAEEAIELLKTNKVISISLDYDLGTEKTGYDVAKFIEEGACNGTLDRLHTYVHSHSIDGAEKIKVALRSARTYWMNPKGE